MRTFQSYQEAYTYAQEMANRMQTAQGIEKGKPPLCSGQWFVRPLPRKEFRYGADWLCQAVEPDKVKK